MIENQMVRPDLIAERREAFIEAYLENEYPEILEGKFRELDQVEMQELLEEHTLHLDLDDLRDAIANKDAVKVLEFMQAMKESWKEKMIENFDPSTIQECKL